jgi:hypothetical protein
MDVNQNYCQSCHRISRNGFIIRKIMSSHSQICCKCMGNVMHLQRPESIAKRFPERHHSGGGLVINLVQRRNGQDRT